MLMSLAVLRMGGVVCTLYATLGDDGVAHGLNELESRVVVTSIALAPKMPSILAKCPHTSHVIIIRDEIGGEFEQATFDIENYEFFDVLEQRGQLAEHESYRDKVKPTDLAFIMYTSGSTVIA